MQTPGCLLQGKIGRDDVADLCVHLLSSKAARDCTFEVKSTVPFAQPWQGAPAGSDAGGESASTGGAPTGGNDWEALLNQAGLVEGVTGKTVEGVYTGTRVEAEAAAEAKQSVAA
jgi:hypothetical protein